MMASMMQMVLSVTAGAWLMPINEVIVHSPENFWVHSKEKSVKCGHVSRRNKSNLEMQYYPEFNATTRARFEVTAFLNELRDDNLSFELEKLVPANLEIALSKAEELEQLFLR